MYIHKYCTCDGFFLWCIPMNKPYKDYKWSGYKYFLHSIRSVIIHFYENSDNRAQCLPRI